MNIQIADIYLFYPHAIYFFNEFKEHEFKEHEFKEHEFKEHEFFISSENEFHVCVYFNPYFFLKM